MSSNNTCGPGVGDTHVLNPALGLGLGVKEGYSDVVVVTVRGRSSAGC